MSGIYAWERDDWPAFRWDSARLLEAVGRAHQAHGRLMGGLSALGFALRADAMVDAVTEEAVKTADIEGETLGRASVRSSVARRLGVAELAPVRSSARIDGLTAMLLEAMQNHRDRLDAQRLYAWQTGLFPDGRSGLRHIRTGAWRDDSDGPMQVVSGRVGNEHVHFEAPSAERVEAEMRAFFAWFNAPSTIDGLLRSAIAHYWFVTIHPFEDGNGRIARAITDQALAQHEGSAQRFYSMSRQIRAERDAYYATLEAQQKSGQDITPWLLWFLGCFTRAMESAVTTVSAAVQKSDAWRRYAGVELNGRQTAMLNRLLDGMQGKLTTKLWAKLTKTSVPTAQRDIADLLERGFLRRGPGGSKNTVYELV